MKEKHLIVISVDALVTEDLSDLSELPNLRKLIEGGSFTKKVTTIYPALTHPIHASIITGQPAGVTGITENTRFTPGVTDMPWYNDYDDIGCETVFDAARKKQLVTAACAWPVTARAGDRIDLLVPEIMGKDMEDAEGDWYKAHVNVGTTECLLEIVREAVETHGFDITHPVIDEVNNHCACEIIRKYRPNLLFTHPGFVDAERHRTGLFSKYVRLAVKRCDEWIGEILKAVKDAGIEESTDIVVLSDHGHLPYSKVVYLNGFLSKEGLMDLDGSGRVRDWKVYVQGCDLSAHVYLKDSANEALKKRTEALLNRWIEEGDKGLESFMGLDEAKDRYGLTGSFSYVIEALPGYTFEDGLTEPFIHEDAPVEPGLSHSAHGHMPHKGPQPVLIGFGPDFKAGEVIERGNILDHFGLFRKILDI